MVQKREDTNSLGLLMVQNGDTASVTSTTSKLAATPILTPTTLKSITDLFESEDCLNKLQTIESDGFVVPLAPPPQPQTTTTSSAAKTKKQSFFKLDTNWTGGTTTVVTPTQSENLSILDQPRKTMLTRSSSR